METNNLKLNIKRTTKKKHSAKKYHKKKKNKSNFLTVFDSNLIQNIFKKLFKKYKYDLPKKFTISYSRYYFTRNFEISQQENCKKYFSEISKFQLVCKMFNTSTKQSLFKLYIDNFTVKVPYNLYLKLSFVERRVEKYFEEENIDSMLIYSCKFGFYDVINILIEKGKANINTQLHEFTPLFEATTNNNIKTIKELFKFENLDINLKSDSGNTPLMEACGKNLENIVSLFLSRNDVNPNIKHSDYYTVLIYASKKGYENIVSLLLSRNDVDPNIQDNKGFTALMYATINNNEKIVSLLLSRNDVNPNIQDNEGFTALIHAIDYSKKNIIYLLLSRNDLDLNIKDNKGQTALMDAVIQNHENIIYLLLSEKNRINVNLKDKNQKKALYYAKKNYNQTIIEMIKNYQKKKNSK